MKKFKLLFLLLILLQTYLSCSKGDPAPPPPSNPCAGVTISVIATSTNAGLGLSDGTITATASGSSSITYSLNGGAFQSGGNFTGLAAGNYTIIAKNTNGCTGSAQVVVATTNPCTGVTINVTATVTNATAANNDGSIQITTPVGTGFTYSVNGGAFQSATLFSGLSAGSFTITAKNAAGCTGSAQFTVTNPCTGVTINVTAALTQPTAGQSNGSINASATGGSGFTFSLNNGTFQSSGLFNNLGPGVYTITAKNSNGCTGSAQFTLTNPNPCAGVTLTVSTSTTSVNNCTSPANGGIAVSVTGGTAPYTFSLNAGAFQSSNLFTGLSANNYTITIRDANGCTQNASATVSNVIPGPLFTAVKQVVVANCATSGCHAGPNPQSGIDFNDDCTIVANNTRIKARAVDGIPSFMPPPPRPQLSAADKQKIVNWVNAGGQINN